MSTKKILGGGCEKIKSKKGQVCVVFSFKAIVPGRGKRNASLGIVRLFLLGFRQLFVHLLLLLILDLQERKGGGII